MVATASALIDRDHVVETFLDLARINGPSGSEIEVAEDVRGRLEAIGFTVEFDGAHESTGGNCGNLFAWWEGTDGAVPPMFLSAHMDTVLPTAGLKPVIEDAHIRTDGSSILGADDRAAIAAYLEGIRAVQESGSRCGPIQVILTVSEQPGLLGARALDYGKVKAERGYVFDSTGDVGQLIVQGPYSSRIHCRIYGKAAHLGLAPEEGINAIVLAAEAVGRMELGKVDDETTASIGVIRGGELPSIIPDRVEMIGEARSLSREGLWAALDQMGGEVRSAAERAGGRAEVAVEEKYQGWELSEGSDHVQVAVRAAERLGIEPSFTKTLGGADTNIFNEHGLTCMTLGMGFRDIHSFREHISVDNLEAGARYVTALIEEHAAAHGS